MPLFPEINNYLKRNEFSGLALGDTLKVALPRDQYLSMLGILVTFTQTGVRATDNADGALNILKRVNLNIAPKGRRRRKCVDSVSGAALIEWAAQLGFGLDNDTLSALTQTANGTVKIFYPIFFADPQLSTPLAELFMLDCPNHDEDPILELNFASQGDMDTNAAKTFAISAGGISVEIFLSQNPAPANFAVADWEMVQSEAPWPASGRQAFNLPTGGSLTGILAQPYTSASARGDITANSDELTLEFKQTIYRRFLWDHIRRLNQYSNIVNASGYTLKENIFLDFLSSRNSQDAIKELGSVLDLNISEGTGTNLKIFQNITGGANVKMRYTYRRIYGDVSKLKLV